MEPRVAEVEALLDRVEALPGAAHARDGDRARAGAARRSTARGWRIVDRVAAGAGALRGAASDELVAHLLLLHGLHPVPVAERVRGRSDEVRPYLGSHGGGVELLGVEDGVVRLRLEGSCTAARRPR